MQHFERLARDSSNYWDENREKANDPTFWMAQPLCRQAINRRVTGSPHEWPLDWFKRVHVPKPLERGVSWGCGLGPFERAARRLGVVDEIDAFDVSPASLEDAAGEARKAGVHGISYRVGDFNRPQLEGDRYDIAFFHASLHHVFALERLFRRLSFAMKPGGLVYVDEYVGPSRSEWTYERLELAQSVLDRLPEDAKLKHERDLPIELNDPSEAIRSSEIPKFLADFCDLFVWRPYGGQILDLVLPCIRQEWALSPAGVAAIQEMLDLEDEQLQQDLRSSHYVVAVGRIKSLPRLARPLGRQVYAALKRRAASVFRNRSASL